MMFLFDVNSVMWNIPWFNYPMSWVEFIGTAFGLWCVWLTAKEKILSWPVGLVNVIFFLFVFWQVQLYSDVLLQVYFFGTGIYGWWKWKNPDPLAARDVKELKVTMNSQAMNAYMIVWMIILTFLLGSFMAKANILLPSIFPQPASYVYWDASTTVMSLFAQWLLTKKRLEAWSLWMIADLIDMNLYYLKGVKLISLEYVVFFFIASYGFYSWYKSWKNDGRMVNS
jgi:nicotinamide mononucleotide transporter